MTISEFIYDRLAPIILNITGIVLLCVFLSLTGTSSGILTIIAISWLFILASFYTSTYIIEKNKIDELNSIMDSLDEKYLFWECIPRTTKKSEQKFYDLMRKSGKSMIESVSNAKKEQNEYREYIERWVHEIKAPVTASQLLCENNKTDATRKILAELSLIEGHVERTLFYARLSHFEKDFVIKETFISNVISRTLSKYRSLLTHHNVLINTEIGEEKIYTDEKWLEFMLGQVLVNAIKYKKIPTVINIKTTSTSEKITLSVKDNGIGIPKAEIKRIFDKGFTGSNGRSRGGSTGIGLYLCQKLSEKIGIKIEAESVESEYTKINFIFPNQTNLTKM